MTKEEIGKIIKESRAAAGLTQSQVSKALGRPQQTIASWESGKSQPDANTLFDLFRVLGRSVDEAFGFTVESFNVTAHERKHIEKYRTLDSYGKSTVDILLNFEYSRCIDQNLADYRSRLDQIGEEIEHIQKAQKSGGRTVDDLTEETRRLESLIDELSVIKRNYDNVIDTMESSIAAMRASQTAPAPQEGNNTTPTQGGLETPPEGE